MLQLYFGNDYSKVRATANTIALDIVQKEKARLTRIESDDFAPGMLLDITGSVSLFGDKEVYLIDTPSVVTEMYDELMNLLAEMSTAPDIFIVMELGLLASEKKKWQAYTQVFEEFTKKEGERFNVFTLAEALSKHDKKSLWLLLN